jgi:hypothetical protein
MLQRRDGIEQSRRPVRDPQTNQQLRRKSFGATLQIEVQLFCIRS